jgi:hypothetical protein
MQRTHAWLPQQWVMVPAHLNVSIWSELGRDGPCMGHWVTSQGSQSPGQQLASTKACVHARLLDQLLHSEVW